MDVSKGLEEGRMLAEQGEKPEQRSCGGDGSVMVFPVLDPPHFNQLFSSQVWATSEAQCLCLE